MYMYVHQAAGLGRGCATEIVIGRVGASPPSRTTGTIFLYIYLFIYIFRSFGLAYRNCLRASFYALSQFFPHGHCTAHALARSDFDFTTSTIDVDSDFHSTRRPVSSSANAHCQVFNWHDFSTYIFIYIVRYRKVNQGTLEYLIIS